MKRYRWLQFFVDTMRAFVTHPALSQDAREENRRNIREWVAGNFGAVDIDAKYERWLGLQPPALCFPGEYHDLLREVDRAYISGAFYPALTGACCLGERILNDLVMKLKAYYTSSERYKEVNRKDSLDDWDRAIGEVLSLLDNETGMHSCLDSKPKLAGCRRRQEEASPWRREYRPRNGQARNSTSC